MYELEYLLVGLESRNIVLSKVLDVMDVILLDLYELKHFQIFILYYLQGLVMGHLKYQLEEEHEQAGVRE